MSDDNPFNLNLDTPMPDDELIEKAENGGYGHTIKNIMESAGMKPEQIVEFTCFHCGHLWNCEFAFDLYNLNGDCLLDK